MRKIIISTDPFGTGVNMFSKKQINLKEGVTVLVGCNGAGKTTFIKMLENYLESNDIPFIKFNNLTDGGSNARSSAGFYGDYAFLAESLCSSEGENIVLNMGKQAARMGSFVNKHPELNEYWFLFDAIDSGLSVDNIIDIKEYLFKTILEKDSRVEGKKVFIILPANEYEMAREENCFDVQNSKYITFKDYDDYRKFILVSKENKEYREKQESEKRKEDDED